MSLKISNGAFNGACILSAVGSLPMHVMPILIASAILTQRMSAAEAGFLVAMHSLGQLLMTTLLPLLSVRVMRCVPALQLCILLTLVILCTVQLSGMPFFLCWFVIGGCCGSLSYLGCTAAAAVENKSIAYSVRLGIILLVAGLSMLLFYSVDKYVAYHQLAVSLAIFVALLGAIGLYLYKPPKDCGKCNPARKSVLNRATRVHLGLFFLFAFSFAQIGFIVFAIDTAVQRGIEISDALWAFALCKLAAAVLLLHVYRRNTPACVQNQTYVFLIAGLLCACVLVSTSGTVMLFFGGVLLWEISANVMSSAFQASVVDVNPAVGGMYLTSVLLFGSALGPLAHGMAISLHAQNYFYYLVLLSVFLPLIWEHYKRSSEQVFRLGHTRESK